MTATAHPSRYTTRLVVFVDVLGFSSAVSATEGDHPAAGENLVRIIQAIEGSLDDLNESVGPTNTLAFTHFSDSFVISVDWNPNNQIRLGLFTLAILDVIDHFLDSGFLLRGGMTQGNIIHTNQLLVGPAMIRAYELESKIARTPRIVIDPALVAVPDSLLSDFVLIDDDGLMYIDYFRPRKHFCFVPSMLLSLQNVIEQIPGSTKCAEKRAWMIKRYNKALADFSLHEWKQRLARYVDDIDANQAIVKDAQYFLEDAYLLRPL